jgi:hypothetical protein
VASGGFWRGKKTPSVSRLLIGPEEQADTTHSSKARQRNTGNRDIENEGVARRVQDENKGDRANRNAG